jgi:hypothetical protein
MGFIYFIQNRRIRERVHFWVKVAVQWPQHNLGAGVSQRHCGAGNNYPRLLQTPGPTLRIKLAIGTCWRLLMIVVLFREPTTIRHQEKTLQAKVNFSGGHHLHPYSSVGQHN